MQPEETSSSPEAPRKPWIAFILGFLGPGAGQIYNGELNKGVWFLILWSAAGFASVLFFLKFPHAPLNIATPILFSSVLGIYILVDAVRTARQKRSTYKLQPFNRWYVYVIMIFVSSAVLSITSNVLMRAGAIPSDSMMPTLQIGDKVLVNLTSYGVRDPVRRVCLALCGSPTRGDVIVFIFPEDRTKNLLKRVIAVGGDTVEIRNKKVYIDGQAVDDPHAFFDSEESAEKILVQDNYGAKKVPASHVFVLGDNRDKSYDSRFWGFVDVADVKGKAAVIYWSWDADARIIRLERIGKIIE
ncbi:MAG TPA: signal peptidase I [Candidatus Binatia bacterium]